GTQCSRGNTAQQGVAYCQEHTWCQLCVRFHWFYLPPRCVSVSTPNIHCLHRSYRQPMPQLKHGFERFDERPRTPMNELLHALRHALSARTAVDARERDSVAT